MSIKGLSQIRRLPRVGIIRLGVKAKSVKGTEYPKAVDYFVCPDEVKKIYGEKPKELDIVLPLDEIDDVFPQFYKRYGSSKGLICKGDGETASQINEKTGEFEEVECLGQKCQFYQAKKCKEVATLNFILPKVQLDGIYQLHTSSFHSIVKINSSLDYIRSMFGKISMLPLKLVVEGTEAHPDKKMKKVVYTLRIAFDSKEIMKSIQKREGLLEQASSPVRIDAPKTTPTAKQAPKIELPSSDENPVEDLPDEQFDKSEVALCDVCTNVLTDKELKSCEKGFMKNNKPMYKYLCFKCQEELGYLPVNKKLV